MFALSSMLFPDNSFYIMFIPYPIKAENLLPGLAVFETCGTIYSAYAQSVRCLFSLEGREKETQRKISRFCSEPAYIVCVLICFTAVLKLNGGAVRTPHKLHCLSYFRLQAQLPLHITHTHKVYMICTYIYTHTYIYMFLCVFI